ncbi:HupE/UreJ family protein [bacterium]|nr:MAG: HupE/UreJ family protein [bacterium]
MRRLFPLIVLWLAVAFTWGHPMPTSSVELRLRGNAVEARLTLPVVELKLGWEKPFPINDAEAVVRDYGDGLREYLREHIRATAPDGRPWSIEVGPLNAVKEEIQDVMVEVTMTPPAGAPIDRFTLDYDAILHHLITHTAIVSIASDWHNGLLDEKPVVLGTLTDQSHKLEIDRSSGSWFQGFRAVFRLGARHIAEGTDHLLFLLALLLPAPLLAAGKKWSGFAGGKVAFRRILGVVTAFTLGHSLTLILGAMGWVRVPSAPIESLIALSIVVSAVHALFPIFRGRETLIAGGFGLVHGLAFASTLTEFGFDPVTMVSSILGFNIGIEAVQILIIAATMPWLVLLARTKVYSPFRIAGASLTALAALAWLFERALGWPNPVGPIVENAAAQGPWILLGLILLSVLAASVKGLRASTTAG